MKYLNHTLSALALGALVGIGAPDTAQAGGTWHWSDGIGEHLDLDRIKDRLEDRQEQRALGEGEGSIDPGLAGEGRTLGAIEADVTSLWGTFLVYWQGSFASTRD